MTRTCSIICLVLMCSGCLAHPGARELDELKQLESSPEQKDARYASFLKTPLDDEIWREGVQERCKVREQILSARRESLQNPSRAALLELLRYSQLCAVHSTQDEELYAQMIARTERDIEREIQPLHEQKRYGEMLAKGPEYMAYLPADHRYARWFMQVRELMAKNWEAQSDVALEQGRLATAILLTTLADDAKKTSKQPIPPDHVVDELFKRSAEMVNSKRRVVMVELVNTPATTGCSTKLFPAHAIDVNAVQGSSLLPTRAELIWGQCEIDVQSKPSGASFDVTMKLTAMVTLNTTLEGASTSGSREFELELELKEKAPLAWTREQASTFFFMPGGDGLSKVDAALVDAMIEEVQTGHSKTAIVEAHRAAAKRMTSQDAALEHTLSAFLLSRALSDEEAEFIRNALGVDVRPFPRPILPLFVWYKPRPADAERMPRQEIDEEYMRRMLSENMPATQVQIALDYGLPEQGLVGQPDRSALGAGVVTSSRWPLLMAAGKAPGFGAIVGLDVGLGFGKRFGGDFEDTASPGIAVYEPDEEFESVSLYADAPVLIGRRGSKFGLFAGVRPGILHRSFGFYVTQGTRVPLMARLEWRGSRIFVAEGWWGGITTNHDNASTGLGLTLLNPDADMTSGWSVFVQRDELPAHFYGLNQTDRVRLEQATLLTTRLGYVLAF